MQKLDGIGIHGDEAHQIYEEALHSWNPGSQGNIWNRFKSASAWLLLAAFLGYWLFGA
jgi:hypothetical protein